MRSTMRGAARAGAGTDKDKQAVEEEEEEAVVAQDRMMADEIGRFN